MLSYKLDDLKLAFSGDLETAVIVAESYLTTENNLKEQLQKAIFSQDLQSLQLALHAIKGALSVFGQTSLYESIKDKNDNLKVKKLVITQDDVKKIIAEMNEFSELIKKILSELVSK
jgi:HPt (histidine-containing phosphotransfer) domain-containing protein